MIDQLELIFQDIPMKKMTYQEASCKLEEFRQIRYRAIDGENWTEKCRAERRMSELLEIMDEMKQDGIKV